MKYSSSAFSVFLVGGNNLLAAKLKGFTTGWESLTEPTDGLGDDHEEHSPIGMDRSTFAQNGAFFDDATNGFHLALRAASGASRVATWGEEGNTIGKTFHGTAGAIVTKYEVLIPAGTGGLTKANAEYQVDGTIEDGVILQTHVQQTIDWTNASVDNAAATSAGGSGFLQVSQFAGLTGFVGVIESSIDNSAWLTLITFANVTAAPASQRIAVAGTVPRYLRFRGDVTGTGTVTVFAGFSRS